MNIKFKETYGITAKEYMRLSRLNAIQQYMRGTDSINLTELSYDKGFADQSHFIREFRSLTGSSPRGFLKERGQFIMNPTRLD
jgi:AraC-like DNA-binding protein